MLSRLHTTPFWSARKLAAVWSAALLICATALALSPEVAANDDAVAKTILDMADQVRFPAGGFEVEVTIRNTAPNKESETRKYKVLAKGNENSLVMVTEPASERGQIMLMKGRDLWVFLPNVSQPVRVPLSQRLTGQVANGDVARTNFAGDYAPTLLRTEVVDGEPTHVLELLANDRSVTYHRVLYWVRQSGHRPYKAEFYSVSGRLLKTAHYRNYMRLGDRVRPAQLVIDNALREGEQSVLDYADLKVRDLPDRIFTKDYLKRLE
jgi:outer membrane lipoprotein-sorting protein